MDRLRKNLPKVSVIVPNYNHAPYLKKRFDSIFAQTYQDFELIILDDCSTDNSREVLDKYRNHPKVSQFVYNEKNSGSTFKQWNKGVALAKGEYIWIAESDDEAAPEFLETLVPKLDANSNVGIAYCQSFRIDEESKVLGDWYSWTDEINHLRWKSDYINDGKAECAENLIVKNTIPNASAVLIRKNNYFDSGGAFEEMQLCGDWMTWIRMLHHSDIYYCNRLLNRFRVHGGTVRSRVAPSVDCMEYAEIVRKICQGCIVPCSLHPIIQKSLLFKMDLAISASLNGAGIIWFARLAPILFGISLSTMLNCCIGFFELYFKNKKNRFLNIFNIGHAGLKKALHFILIK